MRKRIVICLGLIGIVLIAIVLLVNPYRLTDKKIGQFYVFQKSQGLCKMYFEVTIYEDEEKIYYTTYSGCQKDDYVYIFTGFRFISIQDAIEKGIIDPALLEGTYSTKDKV